MLGFIRARKMVLIVLMLVVLLIISFAAICMWGPGSLQLRVPHQSINRPLSLPPAIPANAGPVVIQTSGKHLSCAVLSPNGTLVAFTTSTGSSISIADATTGRPLKSLAMRKSAINPLAFSSDGRSLVSIRPRVWKGASTKGISSMAIPSGGTITVWGVPSFEVKCEQDLLYTIGRIAVDDKIVMFTDSRNNVNSLSIDETSGGIGAVSALLQSPLGVLPFERSAMVAFSIPSSRVGYLVKESQAGRPSSLPPKFVVLGDMKDGGTRLVDPKSLGQEPFSSIAMSANGNWIALGDMKGCTRIYNFDSLKLIHRLVRAGGKARPVTFLRFSPAGDWIVAGAEDGSLQVWKADDGQLLRSMEGNGAIIRDIAFVAGSIRVLSGGQFVFPKLSSDPDVQPKPADTPKFLDLIVIDIII